MITSPDEAASSPTDETPAAPAATANPDPAPPPGDETADLTLAGEAMNLLSEHKGKLAIGVAATLGMMVYYGWREKRLAKTDPEEYARLQRLKAVMRHSDDPPRAKTARKAHAHAQAQPAAGAEAPAPSEPPPEVS